jgi:hypothetical protein
MSDLLEFALDAHGGMDRWVKVDTITTRLSIGGPFWSVRGFPDAFLDETLTIDVHRQHAVFTPWVAPDHRVTLDVDPERVTVQGADGRTIDGRMNPRRSYAGYNLSSAWDSPQVGYFLGYAMWNYLTTPYLLTRPGVQTREIEPWDEEGETWRRLHVTFPSTIATHTAQQIFYFGADGLLRRLDYTVDVNANARAANYADAYRTFDGLVFPTRRRIYPRNPDGTPNRQLPGPDGSAISIDIHDIRLAKAIPRRRYRCRAPSP